MQTKEKGKAKQVQGGNLLQNNPFRVVNKISCFQEISRFEKSWGE
jgi:hypothetical protein